MKIIAIWAMIFMGFTPSARSRRALVHWPGETCDALPSSSWSPALWRARRAASAPQGVARAASIPIEPPRDFPPPTASAEAAAPIADVVVATPVDAGEPEAAAWCRTPRWRIESRQWGGLGGGGQGDVLCDDGSFEERSPGGSFRAHASATQVHEAHALLLEMRQRGQLSRDVASPPREPLQCAVDCI